MKFTLYTASCCGNEKNCLYPEKREIANAEDLTAAAALDHVTGKFTKNYRNKNNFRECDVDVMDCDNDHSDNQEEWIYPEVYAGLFKDVSYVVVPSRHDGKPKNNKTARPRHHVYFPHEKMVSLKDCEDLKKRIYNFAPFFDNGAIDGARFIFGCEATGIIWHEGTKTIDEFLMEKEFADFDKSTENIQEGSRNKSMSLFAGKIIKLFGNTEKARRSFIERSKLCSPPLEKEELAAIWNSAVKFGKKLEQQPGYVPPEEYNKSPVWEEPIAFDEYNLPDFPIETLPKPIGDYVTALSESTQTPVDMAATCAIAVLSVCMQGKFKIRAKADWFEPANTFVLDVMNPSERKSAVENAMIRPLNEFEQECNTRNAAAIESSGMQKRILERRQKMLEDKASKGKADAEEIQRIAEEIAGYKEMKPMKLYVDDITTEKLTSVLADNNGKAAILSTEGGIFDTLAGTYSKNVNIDVMLKGYSGDSIRVDRIGRNSESIMNPALTVLLMVQPSVLSGIMQNAVFKGRGLTARFLYCIPTSFVGKRKYRSQPVPEDVYRKYEKCIRNLLEDEAENEIITLSKEADDKIGAFAEKLELKLNKDGDGIDAWEGKLVGNIQRIAALLCRAGVYRSYEFLEEEEPLAVAEATMDNAIKIGRYFKSHARAAFGLMGADPVVQQCEKVVRIFREKDVHRFSAREVMRYNRALDTAEKRRPVLERLTDYGYIMAVEETGYFGRGRHRAQAYLVNPYIFKK